MRPTLDAAPPDNAREASERLLGLKSTFPVLLSHRAPQPSTWGFDFTTSTLEPAAGSGQSGTPKALPDEDGSHVVVVIWIVE